MKNLTTILLCIIIVSTEAQELTRRAVWNATFQSPANSPGAIIKSIDTGSPLEKADLKVGDIILSVNKRLATSDETWTSITYALRAEQPVQLLVRRGANTFERNIKLNPLPKETHQNLDTYYESVTSDYGITQRMIVTKPKDIQGKQPTIFMVGGLSCSTIETYPGRASNWAKMISAIVENSGMVVVRIEKPGVGDSEGDCAQSDFLTDLAGYRAAIRAIKQKDYIDPSRIIVYGSSMGSALAPLLANEFDLAGIVSDGTFFKTWFEHMLEIERRIRQMQGDDESTIVQKMNEIYIPLYYGMLVEKKSYQEIVEAYPAITQYNYHAPEHMYGRPMAYYQQLQDFDLAGEWEKIKVPVRILYGMNDWIMSEFDNDMIIKVLEKAGHQDHVLHKYPGLDHWNTIHEKPSDSFFGKPGQWDPKMPELVIGWFKELVQSVK